MKNYLFKHTYVQALLLALLFSIHGNSQEKDASNYNMSFEFKTIKQPDNSRLLEASFLGKNKEDRKDVIPMFNAEIKFYNVVNEEEVLLGSAKTNQEGIAQIILSENQKYLTDENTNINLIARFEGNDIVDESSAELVVRNIYLELNLEEIDSVKTVLVTAFTIDELGDKIPLEEEVDIVLFVQGMLSKMKIAEGTISEGAYEFEFPTDLPGDANGDVAVFSIIENHEEFGTIIQQKNANWGVFKKQIKNTNNKLWSSAAPIWMYVVLTILLVGVWANYIYTILNLFKIKKEGQDLELEPEQ